MLRSMAEVLSRALIMYKNEIMKVEQSSQLPNDGDTREHTYIGSRILITERIPL